MAIFFMIFSSQYEYEYYARKTFNTKLYFEDKKLNYDIWTEHIRGIVLNLNPDPFNTLKVIPRAKKMPSLCLMRQNRLTRRWRVYADAKCDRFFEAKPANSKIDGFTI